MVNQSTGSDTAMERAKAGFASLDVDSSVVAAALENLALWLENSRLEEYRPQVLSLIERGSWDLLLDSFYQVIPFGTGGRRGLVGIGPNRINTWTISTSIQGHAQYLRERRGDEDLSVVIAYDVRCFRDAGGRYDPDLPNPLLGLTSRDFAEVAATVYAANGVVVHMLPADAETYVSTPELSFAIRHLKASGGLNVSASHNPSDDNGAKIYNHLGGQEVPPHDEALADLVDQVRDVKRMPLAEAVADQWVRPLGEDIHNAYIEANLRRSLRPKARSAHVVFTGLHGTGTTTVVEVLDRAGFRVDVEPTQAPFDGAFTHVPFGLPNPEVPATMDRAVAYAETKGADLVMACDPDADRLGLVVKHAGAWRFITGNELAVLVVDYGLRVRILPHGRRPIVIKTEVTSSLVGSVARSRGAQVVGHLLVGFKYIGEGLRLLEDVGAFYNAEGSIDDFVVGVEESHGLLVSSEIRDKDAAGGALWLAEAASLEKEKGRTLVDRLEEIWQEQGYVQNLLVSTVMRGAVGRSRIQKIQESMRTTPPTTVGGMRVTAFHDRADARGPFGRIRSGTDAASRDVLVFEFGRRARAILRPSGTEPKNKVYVEVCGAAGEAGPDAMASVDAEAKELANAFVAEMLRRVDIDLPSWALAVSGIVAVEQKIHFARELMPELARRITAGEDVEPWLDAELVPYGRGARALVAEGVQGWIGAHAPPASVAAALGELFPL